MHTSDLPASMLQAQLDGLIHRTFARAIERQLRALSGTALAAWVDGTDAAVLDMFAALYLRACEHEARWPLALHTLVHALDARRLAHLARSFGYARVHLALLQASPDKESAYMQAASPQFTGPRCLAGAAVQPLQALQALRALKALRLVPEPSWPPALRPAGKRPVRAAAGVAGVLGVLR